MLPSFQRKSFADLRGRKGTCFFTLPDLESRFPWKEKQTARGCLVGRLGSPVTLELERSPVERRVITAALPHGYLRLPESSRGRSAATEIFMIKALDQLCGGEIVDAP